MAVSKLGQGKRPVEGGRHLIRLPIINPIPKGTAGAFPLSLFFYCFSKRSQEFWRARGAVACFAEVW